VSLTYVTFNQASPHLYGRIVTGTVVKKKFENRYIGMRGSNYLEIYTYTVKPQSGGNEYVMKLYYQNDYAVGDHINVRVYKGHTVPDGLDKDLMISGAFAIFSWAGLVLLLLRPPLSQSQNSNILRSRSKPYKITVITLLSIIIAVIFLAIVLAMITVWHLIPPPT
jgi:hypothetical protein